MKRVVFLLAAALTASASAAAERTAAVTIDLTPVLQAVASLAVSLVTAFLIPWIRAKYSYEQRRRIAAAVEIAVYAAEQIFGAGAGEQKLQWAVDRLAEKGFAVDRAAIEAEVRKMQSLGGAILREGAAD